MAHEHSAMNHPEVEAISPALVSQSCQTNCVTAERLAVSRKVVLQTTPLESGVVTPKTTVKFLAADPPTSWFMDGTPPESHSPHLASFSILRI